MGGEGRGGEGRGGEERGGEGRRGEGRGGEAESERALVQQPRLFACARCQLQCFAFDAHLCFTRLIWLKV